MSKKSLFKRVFSRVILIVFSISLLNIDSYVSADEIIKNNSFNDWINYWNVKGDKDAVSVNEGWGSDGGNSLNYWSDKAYEVWTEQTIEGLENGHYKVEAYAARGEGQEAIYLYANDFGGEEIKSDIAVSNDFSKVTVDFEVSNGKATIGFYSKANAENWSNFDNVSIVKVENNNLIKNNSFKKKLDNWTIKGDESVVGAKEDWGNDDNFSLNYWSDKAYEVWTEQTIEGLENGYYKVEAYTATDGGQEAIYLYANDFGGSGAKTSVPVSKNFSKVVLNFEVTNGKATIGFYSKGNANNWSVFDNVSITKVEKENKFLKGGDLTMINLMEDKGATYYDTNGQVRDVFHILAENGFNIVRLRTHNDTGKATGIDNWYLPDGYQNTEDILKLAKRAKDVDMEIELTLNYSDWWPNAETQEIPSSWKKEIAGLSEKEAVDRLEQLIYEYTKDVMTKLANQGTIPEYISLGNEMHTGILFPYGKIGNIENFKRFINAGYKAVKEVSTETQVILHLDNAGNTEKYTSFFDTCENNGVNYDVIGASYYPFWTKKNVEDIIPWFNEIGEKYQKKIMIMETGYKWNETLPSGETGQLKDNGNESHSSTPQGQKEFLNELFNGIKNIENNWVIGDLYWDPVMIAQDGVGWAMERGEAADGSEDKAGDNVVSNTTIFDFDGKALTSLNSFRDNSEGTTKGMLSGLVVGEGGNKISNAKVVININGKQYEKVTDKYGRFFIVGLSEGNGEVAVSKNGYSNSSESFSIKVAETTNLTIKLGSGSVQGIVKDTEGNLLEGVNIYANIDGDKISTVSKENGTYMLTDLPEGKNFTIYAEKKGYESSNVSGVDVANNEITKDVNITLKVNSGEISGVIADNKGRVVDGATIVLTSKDGKKYSVATDNSGKYIIKYVLSDTNYKITVSKKGYTENSLEGITIENGKTTSNVDIIMQANFGSIKGVIVDSNNLRIAGAEIKLSRNGLEVKKVSSDENGIFEISDILDNSDYLITVNKENFGQVNLDKLTINPGENKELIIRMSTPINIENSNFDDGNYDGWTIEASENSIKVADRTWDGDDAPSGKYVLNLWSDKDYNADISQEIKGLKPGKYELSAMIYTGGFEKSGVMFINGLEKKLEKTNSWFKVVLPVWIDEDTTKIGFKIDAISGEWLLIDNIEFNYITSIKYDELLNSIENVKSFDLKEYTPISFANLEAKLKIANETLINQGVTQELVDNVNKELKIAIQGLVIKADKSNLILKVEELEKIDEVKYTKESYEKLKEAVLEAKLIIQDENATQKDVDCMLENLSMAFKNLEFVIESNPEDTNEDNNTNNEENNNNNNYNDSDINENNKPNNDNNINNEENQNSNSEETNTPTNTLPITGSKISNGFIFYISILSIFIGSIVYKGKKYS